MLQWQMLIVQNFAYLLFLLCPSRGAVYCDQFVCVCLSVCLSVREHISGTAGPIFTKFVTQISCGCGSVLLRWRRDRYIVYFRFYG